MNIMRYDLGTFHRDLIVTEMMPKWPYFGSMIIGRIMSIHSRTTSLTVIIALT